MMMMMMIMMMMTIIIIIIIIIIITIMCRLNSSEAIYRNKTSKKTKRNNTIHISKYGPGSSVGIAIGYGLDCPGIESRCGPDFLHLSRPALGPTKPPVQWVLGLPRW